MKDKFLHTNIRPKVRTKMMETYYKLGRKAREEGKGKKNNPYRHPNFLRSWNEGWEDRDSEIV